MKRLESYEGRCGSCKYLNLKDRSSVGYGCERPNHFWKNRATRYKEKYMKACSAYEAKDEKEN